MHDEATSIHWHGLHMKNNNWMDGVPGITQCNIAPHTSFTYSFTVNQAPGTHWWHSHTDAQFADGMAGAIMILPGEAEANSLNKLHDIAEEHDEVVMVQDWYHETYRTLALRYTSRYSAFGRSSPPGAKLGGRAAEKFGTELKARTLNPDYPWPVPCAYLPWTPECCRQLASASRPCIRRRSDRSCASSTCVQAGRIRSPQRQGTVPLQVCFAGRLHGDPQVGLPLLGRQPLRRGGREGPPRPPVPSAPPTVLRRVREPRTGAGGVVQVRARQEQAL